MVFKEVIDSTLVWIFYLLDDFKALKEENEILKARTVALAEEVEHLKEELNSRNIFNH